MLMKILVDHTTYIVMATVKEGKPPKEPAPQQAKKEEGEFVF